MVIILQTVDTFAIFTPTEDAVKQMATTSPICVNCLFLNNKNYYYKVIVKDPEVTWLWKRATIPIKNTDTSLVVIHDKHLLYKELVGFYQEIAIKNLSQGSFNDVW